MRLPHLIARRYDPTRNWVADPLVSLELDLSRHALCGVRPGGPADGLSALGPTEDPYAAREGEYRYPSRGLNLGVADGLLTDLLVVFDPAALERSGYQPFVGRIIHEGYRLNLDARTTEEDLVASFGEPWWRDEDEDEILLFYEFGEVEWQVELTVAHTLKALLMVTPPLMADGAQRAAYRVSRPWPAISGGNAASR